MSDADVAAILMLRKSKAKKEVVFPNGSRLLVVISRLLDLVEDTEVGDLGYFGWAMGMLLLLLSS